MVSKEKQAERAAGGLCVACGKIRDGERATVKFCGTCAQKNRDKAARHAWRKANFPAHYTPDAMAARQPQPSDAKERRRQRVRNGQCPRCGRRLSGAESATGFRLCDDCRAAHRRYGKIYEARARVKAEARGDNPLPYIPRGAFLKLGRTKTLRFGADFVTIRALKELRARDLAERRKRDPDAPHFYQVSRIIRAAIRRCEKAAHCRVRPSGFRLMTEAHFQFKADARTLAILRRHAQDRGGNVSATICDMLTELAAHTGFRGATAGRRLSAGL